MMQDAPGDGKRQGLGVLMVQARNLLAALAGAPMLPAIAQADENGISFRLPGQYGSFAAPRSLQKSSG